MMKVCIILYLVTSVLSHHIPSHVGDTEPVLLVVPGVPVRVQSDGEDYKLQEYDSAQGNGITGVVVSGTKLHGNLIVAPGAPSLEANPSVKEHLRRRRGTGYSYTAPDGTSRSEQQDTYIDPRVRDGHPLNRITGRVSWTSPEGVPFTLQYIADGGGYHVLPVAQQQDQPAPSAPPSPRRYRHLFLTRTDG